MNEKQNASENAVLETYKVTSQLFMNEERLIWFRTGVFITLNAIVFGVLQFLNLLPVQIKIVLAFIGCCFTACWHFSMSRMWQYDHFYIRLMREQEKTLNLGKLGPMVRGRPIAEGNEEKVDGELTKFSAASLIFRARFLANAITWIFFFVYLVVLIVEFINITS